MPSVYADLHIHIGSTDSGRPVKNSASKDLTLSNLLKGSRDQKGMDLVGVIDAHVPEILNQLEQDLESGKARELPGGGIRYQGITLLLGSEIEIREEGRKPFHLLSYLPTFKKMKEFSNYLSKGMKNPHLSSQRFNRSTRELQEATKELGGLFIPAHIFTPHKGILSAVNRLEEVCDPKHIDAVELGLSGDTEMADHLPELRNYPFLTNSDAHSIQKIGREYQRICLQNPDFQSLRLALKREGGNFIEANYGLNPSLGKYYRSRCSHCGERVEPYQSRCSQCGGPVAKGVFDRVLELGEKEALHPDWRPPYFPQILLEFFPGVGKKTYLRLIEAFGNEMNLLHRVPIREIKEKFGPTLAERIQLSRENRLPIEAGGGGMYGKVDKDLL
ncbi:endonuclease Q family protein [Thermicanus aegyptius]|uniref:endonuclease Q family protein n=1 Tax=Thermicanus aegyptius TaxID=94009 RepID=UPI0004236532|nr:endonuclease Q family protein [Thermicanus aegyptius]